MLSSVRPGFEGVCRNNLHTVSRQLFQQCQPNPLVGSAILRQTRPLNILNKSACNSSSSRILSPSESLLRGTHKTRFSTPPPPFANNFSTAIFSRSTATPWRGCTATRVKWKHVWGRQKSSTSKNGASSRTRQNEPGEPVDQGKDEPKHNEDGSTGKPLFDRLPQFPHLHRPTRDELLGAATGFWSRFKVHFKWISIRSFRPFNMDEISAFFSWILVGHVVWIIVGTTTFFSLAILLVNTVFAQGTTGISTLKKIIC